MSIKRYARSNIIGVNQRYGTSKAIISIRNGIESGLIKSTVQILSKGQRLDSIAGQVYGDAKLWWIIAAASEIGWSIQAPPGTLIRIPSLDDITEIIG
jgi:hypothetical protein